MADMTYEELMSTHPTYDKFKEEWRFSQLCYEGGDGWLDEVIFRHERESKPNYTNRLKEAYNLNFAEAIVELFNFYLFEKPFDRQLGELKENRQWLMFEKNCDRYGTDYNRFLNNAQKLASITGSLGILVNKFVPGDSNILTVAEEERRGIYPYCASYVLQSILDWEEETDPVSGAPRLAMLKLREEDDSLVTYWYPTYWEQWHIEQKAGMKKVEKVGDGINPLDEIPFMWLENVERLNYRRIGKGDIGDIARIVGSIVRNLSCGEETINFAGFPMMRVPYAKVDETGNVIKTETFSGPKAVQQFDPELGEAGKPDWMEPKIKDSVDSILDWMDRKVDEIYRLKHLSGVHGQRKSNNEVASGLALRYEFQQLNAVLSQKADLLCEADLNIIRLWGKWQGLEAVAEKVTAKRTVNFSVEDLAVALDNIFNSIKESTSKTLKAELEKKAAELLLPGATEETMKRIAEEADAGAAAAATPDGLQSDQN